MRYGYARVSSRTQDYQAQVDALKAAGCEKIFSEKVSGKSTSSRREFDKLMLTIMGGIAQFERSLIRQRCEDGIAKAKAMGTKFGRKAVLDAGKRRVIAERHAKGETMAALARDYDCGEATIWRTLRG